MNNLNPLCLLKEFLDSEYIPFSVQNLRDIEDARHAAAIANSNVGWARREALDDMIRERNYTNNKIKGITSVGGGLAGGYLGKKLGDKIGKVDRIKEFKDMVLRSDTITDLEQKVKKSGFDKVYPQALEYIQKNRGNPKWVKLLVLT